MQLRELPTYPCDNCGTPIGVYGFRHHQPIQVDLGATWHLGGGYGEFIDTMPEDHHKVVLCHDCVVRVFEALPGVTARFEDDTGRGWHPYEGTVPCCRWGWR
jgi:hypothetical protein